MNTGAGRILLVICAGLISGSLPAQDSSARKALTRPEILSSGFLDIATNGHVNATARLIRLYLGEPGRVSIPLSIYSGVSSNNFSPGSPTPFQGSNEQLFSSFLNPMNGIVNVSVEGLVKKKQDRPTFIGLVHQWGARLLTAYRNNPIPGGRVERPLNFFNAYGVAGLYFQTGAWERSDAENLGLFWISARYIFSYSPPAALSQLSPYLEDGLYHGWSFGGGIDISSLVHLRVVFYKYVKKPETGFHSSLCQFSFNYSLEN